MYCAEDLSPPRSQGYIHLMECCSYIFVLFYLPVFFSHSLTRSCAYKYFISTLVHTNIWCFTNLLDLRYYYYLISFTNIWTKYLYLILSKYISHKKKLYSNISILSPSYCTITVLHRHTRHLVINNVLC